MMSVKEYAIDMNITEKEVLAKLKELNIEIQDNMLDEDAIIELDNVFASQDEESDYDLDEKVEEIVEDLEIEELDAVKKEKLKKKPDFVNSKNDYLDKKKAMYKNKEKLVSNKSSNEENIIFYKEGMTVSELAEALFITGTEIIKKLMSLGLMVSLNQPVDYDNATVLALEYNKELKRVETSDISNFEQFEINDNEEDLIERSPVVTIMGHVDHGKTTLLDTIRNANVAIGEAGGITQHIGAYQVECCGKKITFIDTPGHAAFTEMRARGASVTDIVIIIVAADDGVMPQTKEAIDHAKAANVPIIVAINKMDKPDANPERVLTELTQNGIVPESWGGDVMTVNISAKTGMGIDDLLERILLVAEMAELKANPNRYAVGSVIESKLDKNIGSVVTLLVQNGTIRLGDPLVVGTSFGKIRTLKNDKGSSIVEAGPSTPVEVTGLNDVPSAGDRFMTFETEKEAKIISEKRKNQFKEQNSNKSGSSLDDLFNQISSGLKEINVILKADVKGSEEAVKGALEKINVEGVSVKVIRSGVGTITESDVVLANASRAIIIGFNVRPNSKTKEVAKEYNVDIRLYNIIYKVVEEIEAAMKGMLDPVFEEKVLGQAEVRKIFKFSKVGLIAGSYVLEGIIKRDAKARIIRDGIVVYDGSINSIQREKDSVKEVKHGLECGITIDNYNDLKEKDIIEAYEIVEVK